MKNYHERLQNAIRDLHGCESEYVETVSVTEIFQGRTVWDGYVEVYNIRGHPQAKRVYAWMHATGNIKDAISKGTRYVAVLELPPVNSPQTAVRAAIMSEIKDAREKDKGR